MAPCGSGVQRIGPQHPRACRRLTKWSDTLSVCCDPWWWKMGFWWLKHTSFALTSPRREVEWTRFDELAVTSSPLTDHVNTARVCSCCYLTEILGIQVSSVIKLRGGKEGMVGHYAWHIEFLRDIAEAAGQNRKIILFLPPNSQEKG